MPTNAASASPSTPILWADSAYAVLGADLGLAGLNFLPVAPHGFSAFAKIHLEEALETILALHLPKLTGEPIRLLGRTGDYWGDADLFAEDAAGRLHMFEVKPGAITAGVTTQLQHYLLKAAFADPASFVAFWRDRLGANVFSTDRLTMYLAGAHAQIRTANLGWKILSKTPNAVDVSESKWERLAEVDKRAYVQRYLVNLAGVFSGVADARALASRWRERVLGQPVQEWGLFRSSPATVIWLVGSSFDAEAVAGMRGWRAAGVDSRCLEFEVRKDKATNALWIRVRRECFPDRTAASLSIAKWRAHRDRQAPTEIQWSTYTTARASDSLAVRSHKGWPLANVDFTVTVFEQGKSTMWKRNTPKGQPADFAGCNEQAIAEAAGALVGPSTFAEVQP